MATTKPPKRRRLPSGHDEAAYKGHEKWSHHRWAWEFLCRNEEFINACRELPKTPGQRLSEQTRIARRFYLTRFKHCDEPYLFGDKPAFNVVTIWRCNEDQPGFNCKASIHQGEVLIRFNLETALQSSNALPAQLLIAEKRLREHARMLARLRDIKLPSNNKARIGSVAERIRWLRMLDANLHAQLPDARSRGETWSQSEIYRNLFPAVAKRLGRDELRTKFKNAFRTAEKCAQHTYLEMAIAGQKKAANLKAESDELPEQ